MPHIYTNILLCLFLVQKVFCELCRFRRGLYFNATFSFTFFSCRSDAAISFRTLHKNISHNPTSCRALIFNRAEIKAVCHIIASLSEKLRLSNFTSTTQHHIWICIRAQFMITQLFNVPGLIRLNVHLNVHFKSRQPRWSQNWLNYL